MKEIVVKAWCDGCWADGQQRVASVGTWTVGLVAKQARPSLHSVEACEAHGKQLTDVLTMIADTELFGATASPAARPNVLRRPNAKSGGVFTTARDACPICKLDLSQAGMVKHVYTHHLLLPDRPMQPEVCPDCGFTDPNPQRMGPHRQKSHHYSALDEAVALYEKQQGRK